MGSGEDRSSAATPVLNYANGSFAARPSAVARRLTMASVAFLGVAYSLLWLLANDWLMYGQPMAESLVSLATTASLLAACLLSVAAFFFRGVDRRRNSFVLALSASTLILRLAGLVFGTLC